MRDITPHKPRKRRVAGKHPGSPGRKVPAAAAPAALGWQGQRWDGGRLPARLCVQGKLLNTNKAKPPTPSLQGRLQRVRAEPENDLEQARDKPDQEFPAFWLSSSGVRDEEQRGGPRREGLAAGTRAPMSDPERNFPVEFEGSQTGGC